MKLKNIFSFSQGNGPEIIEVNEKKSNKSDKNAEIIDFSFNEYRFGHYEKGGFFKSCPKTAGLWGFFEYITEEISEKEYLMWKACSINPDKYIITARKQGRGFRDYEISTKE
ncbi:MAG: hypothetical protein IJC89_00635 [Clostridia bacterium]|nr:hypothetical protein [Clostridia bacterium]